MRREVEDHVDVGLVETQVEPGAVQVVQIAELLDCTSSRSIQTAPLYSKVCPTISVTPASLAASISSWAPADVVASGFSMSTCLPARIASSPSGTCEAGGVAITTASMCGRAACKDVNPSPVASRCAMPESSGSRASMATTRATPGVDAHDSKLLGAPVADAKHADPDSVYGRYPTTAPTIVAAVRTGHLRILSHASVPSELRRPSGGRTPGCEYFGVRERG